MKRIQAQRLSRLKIGFISGLLVVSSGFSHAAASISILGADTERERAYQKGIQYIGAGGVERDIAYGRYWLTQAARQGHPIAQYLVGRMFYEGVAGEQDPHCAWLWLSRATEVESVILADAEQTRFTVEEALLRQYPLAIKVFRPVDYRRCELTINPRSLISWQTTLQWAAGKQRVFSRGRVHLHVGRTLMAQWSLWTAGYSLAQKYDERLQITNRKRQAAHRDMLSPMPASSIKTRSPILPLPSAQITPTIVHPQVLPLPTKGYAVQLAGAVSPEGLFTLANRHQLTLYAVYETVHQDRPWFVLVSGVYTEKKAAIRALSQLPSGFKPLSPWVRRL